MKLPQYISHMTCKHLEKAQTNQQNCRFVRLISQLIKNIGESLRNVENGPWQSYPSGFVCKVRAKCSNVTNSGVTSHGTNLFMYACIYVCMYFISSSTVEPI